MEPKKNPNIDVNNASSTRLFFQIGLSLALLVTFGLFSFKVIEKEKQAVKVQYEVDDIEMVEATKQEPPKEKPPVEQQVEVVDDEEEIKDTTTFKETEFKEDFKVKEKPKLEVKKTVKKRKIFTIVEQQAEFPGGYEAMQAFIQKMIEYPDEAYENDVSGIVQIEMTVDETGKIIGVKPAAPLNRQIGFGLEEEAVRVVKKMPNWKPAKQASENVAVKFTIPIFFELQ